MLLSRNYDFVLTSVLKMRQEQTHRFWGIRTSACIPPHYLSIPKNENTVELRNILFWEDDEGSS